MIFKFLLFPIRSPASPAPAVTKGLIAQALSDSGVIHPFPAETEILLNGKLTPVSVQYTFEPEFQEYMEKLFHSYRPDYGAFVAIDATSGRVLSMVSYTHHPAHINLSEHLALRATFPAASVFKVVTAAAAIAERNFNGNTVIPFNGSNHTLYRSNILKTNYNRWIRHMTLKEAFARSVNTVFGKIGAYEVGADQLKLYADRFGFNRKIDSDLPIQVSKAPVSDDPWSLAETASGYTPNNTMSPLQGALIGSAVVNNGVMMEPYVVQSIHSTDGQVIYEAEPKVATLAIDSSTAAEVRTLMRETVRQGTSKRSFNRFFHGKFASLDVGGKTGSLSGTDPKGKYDWFIGFADKQHSPIAIAVLTIHDKFWRVRSSYLARKAIEKYFQDQP